MDSTVEAVADYLARCPGFLKRTLRSIDNALEAGMRVSTKSVITPYNLFTIPGLYRDLRRRGVSEARLALYGRSGYHHSDDLFNSPDAYRWLASQVELLHPEDRLNIQNGMPQPNRPAQGKEKAAKRKGRNICAAGRAAVMICADGKVIPREQMPEIPETFCGDLKTQSLQEIWESKALEEKTVHFPREKFVSTPCFKCEEFEECLVKKGFCMRDSYVL